MKGSKKQKVSLTSTEAAQLKDSSTNSNSIFGDPDENNTKKLFEETILFDQTPGELAEKILALERQIEIEQAKQGQQKLESQALGGHQKGMYAYKEFISQDRLQKMEQDKQAIRTELAVHGLKQDVDQSKDLQQGLDFSDKVQNVLGKRAAFNPKKNAQCSKCEKKFGQPWQLKRHMGKCR